jgi:hypothetical protein
MSGVFRNIDPPPPHHPASVYPPPLVRGDDTLAAWRGVGESISAGGGHTRWVERGWGVNSSEDARHCSVLNTV